MYATTLQLMLGLGGLPLDVRIPLEFLIANLALLTGVALRRRKWLFSGVGFVWLALGMMLDLAVPLVRGVPALMHSASAFSLIFFACGLVRLLMDGLETLARHGRRHFSSILRDLIQIGLYAAIVMLVLWSDFHVNVAPLLATAGVLTVVIGLALQETLGNIFSGLALQLQKPFDPGDWVRTGEHLGRVLGIGMRSTTIVTRANERLEVPNSAIAKDILVNYGNPPVADEIALGLSYDEPPNRVREVILKVLRDIPQVQSQPAPTVLAWSYDESSIRYRVKYWIADYTVQEQVRDDFLTSLWYALRRHSMVVPFPIRTLEMSRRRAKGRSEREYEREVIAELRAVDFLRELSDDELRLLVPHANVRQFGAGEALVREGETGDSLYIVRSGVVRVAVRGPDGEQRHITDMKRPAIVGEMGMMTGEARSATVRALSDVEVLEIGREGFSELFKKHPETVAQISDIIAARHSERREILAASGEADGHNARRNWLVAKMRHIFDI